MVRLHTFEQRSSIIGSLRSEKMNRWKQTADKTQTVYVGVGALEQGKDVEFTLTLSRVWWEARSILRCLLKRATPPQLLRIGTRNLRIPRWLKKDDVHRLCLVMPSTIVVRHPKISRSYNAYSSLQPHILTVSGKVQTDLEWRIE